MRLLVFRLLAQNVIIGINLLCIHIRTHWLKERLLKDRKTYTLIKRQRDVNHVSDQVVSRLNCNHSKQCVQTDSTFVQTTYVQTSMVVSSYFWICSLIKLYWLREPIVGTRTNLVPSFSSLHSVKFLVCFMFVCFIVGFGLTYTNWYCFGFSYRYIL